MSGIFTANWAPPDFQATQARAQQMRHNALAAMLQQRQMEQEQQLSALAPGLASADPAARQNALAQMAGLGWRGAQVAMPMLSQERDQEAMDRIAAIGAPAAAPAAPAAPSMVAGGSTPRLGGAVPRSAVQGVPDTLSDEDLVARTIIGEAAGEGAVGQRAVAHVIANRVRGSGMSARDVVLAPNQFEPWGARRDALLRIDTQSPQYQQALAIAREALAGQGEDPTGGATHFYAPRAQAALGRSTPAWAQGREGRDIGNHRFYSLGYSGGGRHGTEPREAPAAEAPPAPAPARDPVAAQIAQLEAQAEQYRRLGARVPAAMQAAQQIEARIGRLMQTERRETPLPPEVEEQRIRIAQASRPQVNVDTRGAGAFAQERGKTLAGEEAEIRQGGRRAVETLARIQNIERVLPQFTTGVGAETRMTAGQIASRLGVPEDVLRRVGIDPASVASGESIRSLSSQMLLGLIGPGGFPAQNFSNADREMLERALPSLGNTPQGNQMILRVMRAQAERSAAIARSWDDWRRQNGSTDDSFDRWQLERLPEITSQDIIAPLFADASGGGAPRRVSTPEEAMRLPPGTPIILPDGTPGRVPERPR